MVASDMWYYPPRCRTPTFQFVLVCLVIRLCGPEKLVPTPRNRFGALPAHREQTWRPRSSTSSSAALCCWRRVGEMVRLTLKKGAALPTARPLSSSPLSVRAIGAGLRARSSLPATTQPLSLTVPRIYPLRCYGFSRVGRCRHHGEARHSSPCGHGHLPEARRVNEEHSVAFFRHRHR